MMLTPRTYPRMRYSFVTLKARAFFLLLFGDVKATYPVRDICKR